MRQSMVSLGKLSWWRDNAYLPAARLVIGGGTDQSRLVSHEPLTGPWCARAWAHLVEKIPKNVVSVPLRLCESHFAVQ